MKEAANALESLGSAPPTITRQRGATQFLDVAESSASGAHNFKIGDLVWAQFRLDGLWYAGRILKLLPNSELEVEYIDYKLSDTAVSASSICPDYNNLLKMENRTVRAFDTRPSQELLAETKEFTPDTFGLVRFRAKTSRKPNHSSLLLKRTN